MVGSPRQTQPHLVHGCAEGHRGQRHAVLVRLHPLPQIAQAATRSEGTGEHQALVGGGGGVEIKKIMIGSARIVSQLILASLPYFTKALVPVTDI